MKKMFLIVILLSLYLNVYLQTTATKIDLIKKWQSIFSDSVDFSNKILFDCMVYIGPQPLDIMKPFSDFALSQGIKNYTRRWFAEFFKPEFFLDIDSISPDRFYLSVVHEMSNLYYNWDTLSYSFSMYDSYNGVLIRIKPKHFQGSISKELLADSILIGLFNLSYKNDMDIYSAFNLPDYLDNGSVFSNTNKEAAYVRGWKNHIVGFITQQDICIILFKAQENRSELGFAYKYDWLKDNILEKKKN